MRVLYIGGSGEISFDCIHESVRLGHEVTVFNRGNHNAGLPRECRFVTGDIDDDAAYGRLAAEGFDIVCQFRLFTPAAIRRDIALFAGHCAQYVFISSASAYRKPVRNLPITEATPLENPYWAYSRAKAEMEGMLQRTARRCHSRSCGRVTRTGPRCRRRSAAKCHGCCAASRSIVHGDGESLWTVTHSRDFARPFARLLGNAAGAGRGVPHHRRPAVVVERDLPGDRGGARRADAADGACRLATRSSGTTRSGKARCSATRAPSVMLRQQQGEVGGRRLRVPDRSMDRYADGRRDSSAGATFDAARDALYDRIIADDVARRA